MHIARREGRLRPDKKTEMILKLAARAEAELLATVIEEAARTRPPAPQPTIIEGEFVRLAEEGKGK